MISLVSDAYHIAPFTDFPHIIYIICRQKQNPANQNAVCNHVPAQIGIHDHQQFDLSLQGLHHLLSTTKSSTMPQTKDKQLHSDWTVIKKANEAPITVKVGIFKIKLTLQDQYARMWCNQVLAEHATHFKEHLYNLHHLHREDHFKDDSKDQPN